MFLPCIGNLVMNASTSAAHCTAKQPVLACWQLRLLDLAETDACETGVLERLLVKHLSRKPCKQPCNQPCAATHIAVMCCRTISLADRLTMLPLLYSILDYDRNAATYEKYDKISAWELFQR